MPIIKKTNNKHTPVPLAGLAPATPAFKASDDNLFIYKGLLYLQNPIYTYTYIEQGGI